MYDQRPTRMGWTLRNRSGPTKDLSTTVVIGMSHEGAVGGVVPVPADVLGTQLKADDDNSKKQKQMQQG